MIQTKASYSLKQFTSSADVGFAEALLIYAKHTPPALRTNTNEISYWVDNWENYGVGKLLVMGFYCGRKLIGFAEMACLPNSQAIIVDYLTIDEGFRQNNVYFEFIAHLQRFIINSNWSVHYIVTEIGGFGSTPPPDSSRLLIRLLKFSGFKVVKAPYYQPQLGEKNFDSQMEAILMIYILGESAPDEQISLTKQTYMSIVESIYFDHYLQWYAPHISNIEEYKSSLTLLAKKIQKSIKGRQVVLNGHHYLIETKEVAGVMLKKNHGGQILISALLVAFIMFLAGGLQYSLEPSLLTTALLVLIVFTVFIGVLAALKESPTTIFKEALKIILKVLHRAK